MNKILLTIIGLAFFKLSFSQMGQLQNGGFENWTNQVLSDTLDEWDDSNADQPGPPTVFQSSDAADAMYSAEISAAVFGPNNQDTTFGYIFHGVVGNNGPEAGISYTSNFDEVKYQYKADMDPGDTLYLLMIRYNSGVPGAVQLYPAAFGQVGTWTQGSINVATTMQDELFIGFVMGNPFGDNAPSPNSAAWIDDVRMFEGGVATTDLPDPSIENWNSVSVEEPNNWYTLNNILVPAGISPNVNKSTDAASGSYAAELSVVYSSNNQDTISGIISLGQIYPQSMNPFLPEPYEAMPTELTGSYKYAPSNLDTGAGLFVEFYNNGSVLSTLYQPFTSNASYTSFTLPINLSSAPDSIVLYAFAGNNPGTVLHLDDLAFNGGDVSLDKEIKIESSVYPNPVSDQLFLRTDKQTNYEILDIMGNEIRTGRTTDQISTFDVADFQKGVYFFKLRLHGETTTIKFVKR